MHILHEFIKIEIIVLSVVSVSIVGTKRKYASIEGGFLV